MKTKLSERIEKLAGTVFGYIIDTIAPPDPTIRMIELMDPGEFTQNAAPGDPGKDIKGVISLFSYKDPLVKAAILDIKSHGNKKIARVLGEASYELILAELSELETFKNFVSPILIPIPMTKRSLRRRGWNQCELLTDEIARIDRGRSIEVRTDILVKSRETPDQVGKSRAERLVNLKGSFAVRDPGTIRGRNVVILDDIVTTGATLSEARRELLRAGAKKVICTAISH